MTINIRGTAHPAPPRGRRPNPADLTSAEISQTDMANRPLLYEHDASDRVGTVLASWQGADGSLRVSANVHDEGVAKLIKNGTTRGLSLGTDMIMGEGGEVLYRKQSELSVCAEGKREGTWIDHVDGRVVHATHTASKQLDKQGATR